MLEWMRAYLLMPVLKVPVITLYVKLPYLTLGNEVVHK